MAKSVSREKEREKDKPKNGAKTAGNAKAAASRAPVNGKAQAAPKPALNGKAPAAGGKPAAASPRPAPASAKPATKEIAKSKEREAPRPVKEAVKYKCPMAPSELKQWRELLLTRRSEITDDIEGLVKDAMDAEDGHTTPNHIAERGSDADLQDMSLGVVGEEKEVVWQIDRALRKIDAAKPIPFGLCEYTKEPIPKTRLQLIPWTPLSIEGATHMEKNSLTLEDLLADE